MQILKTSEREVDLVSLLTRGKADVFQIVQRIIGDVRENGNKAIVDFTRELDGVETSAPVIMFRDELESYCNQIAKQKLTKEEIEAIENAVSNVSWFAKKSIPVDWEDIGLDGQLVGEKFTPFKRVACYVPQGSFPLVSTAIHTAAIANTVGVEEIVMVTSPSQNDLNPAVAWAAYKSGVSEIVFVGGAQGIAGVALGTESIRKVDFICGPGNQYVAEAKRQLFGEVGIDMVAGPSEVFVIADQGASPYSIACDLIAQAEHGSGQEASVLLSDSEEIIANVQNELRKLKTKIVNNPGFEKVWENSIYLVVTESIDEAIEMVNACAPEHVEIQTEDARAISKYVRNAGAVFIGNYSPEPIGDFVAGPSHVLPTNSTARFTSGLSAMSFFRRTSTIEIDANSYPKLSAQAKVFAEMEGLTGHGMSSVSRKNQESSQDD